MARQRSSQALWIGVAALAIIAVVVVGIALLIVGTRPSSPVAPGVPSGLPTAIIAALTQAPSRTPAPTHTPFPTATPRNTSTPRPTATATTDPVKNLAQVLPPLNQSFQDSCVALFKAADALSTMLSQPDRLSTDTLKEVDAQTNQIRKLRNEILLVNLSRVPSDVRQQIITPAHTAYREYANSVLQLVDLKRQASPGSVNLGQATPSTQGAETQSSQIAKQEEVVKSKRTSLETALTDYNVFAAQAVLTSQVSQKAEVYTSQETPSVELSGGRYKVSYRLDTASPSKAALWLIPSDSKVAKVQIAGGSNSGSQIIELKAGSYRFQAESINWWVVALEAQ